MRPAATTSKLRQACQVAFGGVARAAAAAPLHEEIQAAKADAEKELLYLTGSVTPGQQPFSQAVAQTDCAVPTSNGPFQQEWTTHYWYVMFSAALQAGSRFNPATKATEPLPEQDRVQLVAFFHSLQTVLCCPHCRTHYQANFQAEPFTMEHAGDRRRAVEWVLALRRKIEAAKATEVATAARPPRRVGRTVPAFPGMFRPAGALMRGLGTTQEAHGRQRRAIERAMLLAQVNDAVGVCECTNALPPLAPAAE